MFSHATYSIRVCLWTKLPSRELDGTGYGKDITQRQAFYVHSTHHTRREPILMHKIHRVTNPTHEWILTWQMFGMHVKMVVLTRPAVPHLGLYLGGFPDSSVLLRGGLDFFTVGPLPEAIGCSAAHRVGGLMVFLFEFFWKVILRACPPVSALKALSIAMAADRDLQREPSLPTSAWPHNQSLVVGGMARATNATMISSVCWSRVFGQP